MNQFPELSSLCRALKRPDLYDDAASKFLTDEQKSNQVITSGSCSLFHHLDAWDTELAGFSVGKVELVLGENRADIQACVEKLLEQKSYHYIVIRLSQHHIHWIQSLETHGAMILDTTVDLATLLPINSTSDTSPYSIVRAEHANAAQLSECYQSFNQGRFFTDPEVSYGAAAYKEWVSNSIAHKAAREVLVLVDENENVQGLLSLKTSHLGNMKILNIPLIVKHPKATASGVSQKLLMGAFSATRNDHYDAALISTQGSNIAAQLGYLSAGFKPYNTGVTLRILTKA